MLELNIERRRWWDFLVVMTTKEIKVRYKMTLIGLSWAFLNPVIQMLVMGIVFRFFVPVKVDNYFIFLFSGLLLWNFVSLTISRSTTIIINERMLIQKSMFPREILVLSVVAGNLIHLLISLGLLLIVLIFLGYLSWSWILLPLILLPVVALVSGISLLLSALNVRFRDINFVSQVMVSLWFYVSPILYTLDLLPEKFVKYFLFNPLTGILDFTRALLIGMPLKFLWIDILSLGWCIWLFVVGILVFKKTSRKFDEWV